MKIILGNINCLRIQGEYITQDSEEIENRETQNLSQEFSKTEKRFLSGLSRLDEFLLNPHIRFHSGHVPETHWKLSRENLGGNADRSQNEPHPEVGVSLSQSSQELNPGRPPKATW